MKVYIAKTLIEGIDLNSCSVEVFETREGANDWASDDIDLYLDGYEDAEVIKENDFYQMKSGDVCVTIEIEEKDIYI